MKRLKWAAAGLGLALMAAGPAEAQRVDGIAAVVNDDVVLQSEVEEQLYLFVMRNQIRPDSTMVDTLRRQVLNQLIDEKLIVAEAKRQGLTVSDAEVNKQAEAALQDAKDRMGSDQGFREQLARENLTEDKLRDKYRGELRRQLLVQRLVQKQSPSKAVTATEAEAYFKANHDKFPHVPPELKLQVIQIPATADSATDAKGKAAVLAARRRIIAGEKFAKVAADVSEDPGTARSGGDLGFFGRGAMDTTIEQAAFSLKIGQLSQPIRSPYGWHLMEVIERDTIKTKAGKDSLDAKGKPAPEAHVRHILIRVPISDDDAARARRAAERLRSEALKGTDFGTLAKRYSKYSGPIGPGGDLGYVSLGTLQEAIRSGLDSLKTGQISEVLPNQVGYNIFKVNDRRPEREYTVDEIREQLPDAVAQMKQRDKIEEWLKGLRSKAHIEIRNS